MTRSTAVSLILLWLSLPSLVLAGSFEGVVTWKMTSEGKVETAKVYFKGEKMRVDSHGMNDSDGSYTVFDGAKKELFVATPEDKTYTVMPWGDIKPEDAKSKDLFGNTTLTRTGKKDKVAGQACEVYLVKDADDSKPDEACIARGISNSAFYLLYADDPLLHDFVKDGGFPLQLVNHDKTGKVVLTLETTKVEATKLSDSVFAPPSGFKKTTLGD